MNIIFSLVAIASLAVSSLFGVKAIDNAKEIRNLEQRQTEYGQHVSNLITQYSQANLGAVVSPVATMTFTLYGSGVSSSATSITLSSLTLPQTDQLLVDSDFSETFYITLEPGNRSRQEIASCTTVTQNANGTATLSGCTRGLSPITPFTASSTLQFAHGGNTSVIFSDPPQLFNEFSAKKNSETITGQWTFNDLPESSLTATTSSQFTTKQYVDSVSNQGAATSTATNGGIVELGTAAEASSAFDGGANKPTVLTTSIASSSRAGNSNTVVVTRASDGFISETFIATSSVYNWAGSQSFNASTSLNATTTISASATTSRALLLNGQPYAIASTQFTPPTSIATGTPSFLANTGQGDLAFTYADWQQVGTVTLADGTQGTTTITGLPPRSEYLITFITYGFNGNAQPRLRFNTDGTLGNYGYKVSDDFVVMLGNSQNGIQMISNSTSTAMYMVIRVSGDATQRKLVSWTGAASASGAQAPIIYTGGGVWNNTSASINRIEIDLGASLYNAGARMTVYAKRN